MTVSDQRQVIDALNTPALHGLKAGVVEVIETHANLVFLAGDEAIKIKKAVDLGYLDFSTLEKRQAACRREFEVNRPNAPSIYRGVKPVNRDAAGRFRLGGKGRAVEWCVVMRRFRPEDVLDKVAEAGPLSRPLALALADAVAASHARAAAAPEPQAAEAPDRVARQLAEAFARHRGIFDTGPAATFNEAMAAALAASRSLRLKRAGEGATRRCHGDLHLANIVLVGGRPRLFDALEFDERLARIDVLYDLAFLLMDLEARGQRPAASLVVNRYLTATALMAGGRTQHDAALGCLAPFAALRAGIRGLVAADRSAQLSGIEAKAKAGQARVAFAHACALMAQERPGLMVIGGLSGTGKSTVAAHIAPDLARPAGALHLRSDIERKTMAGLPETAKLHHSHYTPQASAAVYRRLYDRAGAALSGGFPVIVDAVFAHPEERAAIEAIAHDRGAPFHALWLEAPREVLEARVGQRRGDASDADRRVVEMQLAYDTGEIAWPRLDAVGTPQQVIAAARKALGMV